LATIGARPETGFQHLPIAIGDQTTLTLADSAKHRIVAAARARPERHDTFTHQRGRDTVARAESDGMTAPENGVTHRTRAIRAGNR
jgi:hypothetical protein